MIKRSNKKIHLIILSLLLVLLLVLLNLNKSSAKFSIIDKKNCVNEIENDIVDIDNIIEEDKIDEGLVSDSNVKSEEKSLLYSDYIKTEGNISDELIYYLDLRLRLIPKDLLLSYFNQGGSILITNKDISQTYYSDYNFGNIIGLHDARKNIIFMSNSKYAIDNALIHEFGHVLDSLSGWDSMNEYFLKVFEKEKDSFDVESSDGHYKSNEREFFAEVFQESILNPDTCKSSAPEAFNFVNSKIKSLN